MLQIAGLYKATLWGVVGLVAGGQLGINSASRGAYCLARLTPGFMMAAMLFPRLQVMYTPGEFSISGYPSRGSCRKSCRIVIVWMLGGQGRAPVHIAHNMYILRYRKWL